MVTIAQSRKGVIYAIKDPNTNLVVYIGKSFDFIKRKSHHLTNHKNSHKKSNWIKSILEKGQKPIFEIIDECDEVNWKEKERQYIKLYKSFGANLLNVTEGGEVGSMGHKRTEEEKEYYRKLYTGRKNSPEQRLLNSISLKEKWANDVEYRKKATETSISNLKKITPEQAKKRVSKMRFTLAKKSKITFCICYKVYDLVKNKKWTYKDCAILFGVDASYLRHRTIRLFGKTSCNHSKKRAFYPKRLKKINA